MNYEISTLEALSVIVEIYCRIGFQHYYQQREINLQCHIVNIEMRVRSVTM